MVRFCYFLGVWFVFVCGERQQGGERAGDLLRENGACPPFPRDGRWLKEEQKGRVVEGSVLTMADQLSDLRFPPDLEETDLHDMWGKPF